MDELMRSDPESVSMPLILHLQRQVFQHVDGRGGNFKSDDNAIVSFESGRRQVVFESVSARETPFATTELVARYLGARPRPRRVTAQAAPVH